MLEAIISFMNPTKFT